MARDISKAVQELCLAFPETEQVPSRGSPDFRVGGKTFATYSVNHHGDGRVALWLRSPPGAQQLHTEHDPEHYFVPPYVGPRGWLGVELDKGLAWATIAQRVHEAWAEVAPARIAASLSKTPRVAPPTSGLAPADIDPMKAPRARVVLEHMRAICLGLPETSEDTQFGAPVWKAGRKTFAGAHHYRGKRLSLTFWVGPERQAMLTFDRGSRYHVPAYTGHNGWIALDVEDDTNWDEVEQLAHESYRHFALKRMLKALDDGQP
jgi:hypothetical protein